MSLKNRISQSVTKAFNALDDLKGPMTVTSQVSDPVYDPSTGTVTKSSLTFTVQAVFDSYELDRVDGTMIQREDRRILIKPLAGFAPKVGDTIQDGDLITYTIMDVDAVKTFDEVFLWEVQARK